MDPIETLTNIIVHGYAVIVAFLIGWTLPRGKSLRMVQLKVLRTIHNFLAYEDEIIQDQIKKTKQSIKGGK